MIVKVGLGSLSVIVPVAVFVEFALALQPEVMLHTRENVSVGSKIASCIVITLTVEVVCPAGIAIEIWATLKSEEFAVPVVVENSMTVSTLHTFARVTAKVNEPPSTTEAFEIENAGLFCPEASPNPKKAMSKSNFVFIIVKFYKTNITKLST